MSRRFRPALALAFAGCLVLSLATPAFARPASLARDARASYLASRHTGGEVSAARVSAASAGETTLTIASTAWYTDSWSGRCLDGIITLPDSQYYKDVWVLVQFRNKYGAVIATDELLSNEYVVDGKGTFSGWWATLPTGTTKVVAVNAWGTATPTPAYTLLSSNISVERLYPGDRSILLSADNTTSGKTLSDVVVSAIETTGTGAFFDVAVGLPDSDLNSRWANEDYALASGESIPFSLWGARKSTIVPDQAFIVQGVENSTVSAAASPTALGYGGSTVLTGTCLDSLGAPVAGMPVLAVNSADHVIGEAVTGLDGSYSITTSKLYTRTTVGALSLGTSYLAADRSDQVFNISVRAYVTTPSGPKYASYAKNFTSYTYLRPRHTAGSYPIVLKCYRLLSGKWVYHHSVKAKASNYSTYTKCTASVRLPHKGTWRIQAQHSDSGHALTKSPTVRTIYVR